MDRSEKLRSRLSFLADLAWWAAILGAAVLALKLVCAVLPLLLGFLLAAAARPLARFLSRETRFKPGKNGERVLMSRRLRLRPPLAGVLSVLALLSLLGALAALLAARAADALTALMAALPGFYEEQLEPGINMLYQRLLDASRRLDPSVARALTEVMPELTSSVGSAVTAVSAKAVGAFTSLAAALPGMLLTTGITVIAAVFMAADYDRLRAFLRKNLPSRPLHYLMTVRNSFVDMAGRLARSYLLILLITTGENILGLALIGVPRPVLPGLVIGLVDIFPVVGSGTVLLPWAAVCLLTGDTVRAGGLVALYVVITVVRQILEPRIVGKRVGLRPIVTLSCMVAGGRLFGAVGLIALPVMAAILADLDSSGVIALFQHPDTPGEEEKIHSEGIEA